MSELNDPRVLFAAERTAMAWSRTAAALMTFGFVVDRSALLVRQVPPSYYALAIGLGFVLLGIALSVLSIVQYRRSLAQLRATEIPPGYWVHLTAYASAAIALLGVSLAAYLVAA